MIYKFKEFKDEPLLINHLNMGGKNPKGEEINVTSRYFTRNGKPWIGVMGEFHFSRYGRENWHRELAKMKAGGITIVGMRRDNHSSVRCADHPISEDFVRERSR